MSRPVYRQPAALALVAVGGMAGTTVRALTAAALAVPPGHWPTATFTVNLVGAFILGMLLEAISSQDLLAHWALRFRLLLGTGFCGALTTYSTLAVEADLLIRSQHPVLAGTYVIASVLLGLIATAAGIWAGNLLGGRR
ncbi:MAG TPA: CrcB family protein [Kineosporiaceae bacterium]|nr:CrcB family protein [Kineosporiaceae bacterium]